MNRLLFALLVLAVIATQLPTSEGSAFLGSLLGSSAGSKGNSGLLDGLLGGKDNLVGKLLSGLGLNKLLEQILCLLQQLGLDVVVQLIRGLGVDALLGLNEIACQEGGDKLLGFLFSEDGLLGQNGLLDLGSLVAEVLCLVDDVGLETVVDLIDQLEVDQLLQISEYICSDGEPLFGSGQGGAILGILSGKSGLLAGLLSGDLDLHVLIGDLLCFAEWNGLDAVNDLVDQLEVDQLLGISEYICKDGKPLFSSDDLGDCVGLLSIDGLLNGILSKGLNLKAVLGDLLCVVEWNGFESVTDLVDQLGVDDLLDISDYICKDGQYLFGGDEGKVLLETMQSKDGPLGDLLKSGLDIRTILGDVRCLVQRIGLQEVMDLILKLGVSGFSEFGNCVCKNGRPLFSADEGKVIDDWLSGKGPLGDLDIKALSGDLLCVIRMGGMEAIMDLLDSVGVDRLLEVSGYICKNGESRYSAEEEEVLFSIILFGKGLLGRLLAGGIDIKFVLGQVLCFVRTTGLQLEQVIDLIDQMGVDSFLNLNKYVCRNNRPIYSAAEGHVLRTIFEEGFLRGLRIDMLVGDLLCILEWSSFQAVVHFVDKLGVDNFFDICDFVCRDGQFLFTEDEGDALLWILLSDDTILRGLLAGNLDIETLLEDALCFVQGMGLQETLELFEEVGVEELRSLSGYFCKNGKPSVSADEEKVLINILVQGGLLDGRDITNLVGDLLCMLKWSGLQALVDLVDQLGVDCLFDISDYVCKDGKFLFTAEEGDALLSVLLSGNRNHASSVISDTDLRLLLENYLCMVRGTDAQTAKEMFDQLGVDDFIILNELACANGQPSFSKDEGQVLVDILFGKGFLGGLNIKALVGDLLCVIKWGGLKAVVDLVDELGVDNLLDISRYICKNGNPLFSDEEGVVLIDILLFGKGLLTDLLKNGLDVKTAITKLLCIVEGLGMENVIDIANDLGEDALLDLMDAVCEDGELQITAKGHSLILLILPGGGSLDLDILNQILCMIKSLKLEGVLKLLSDLGLDTVLGLYDRFCPGGQPFTASECPDTGLFPSFGQKNDAVSLDDIEQLHCLIKIFGLTNIIDLTQSIGLEGALTVQDSACQNGLPLIDFASLEENEKVIILKITKAVGADKLDWLIQEFDIDIVVDIGIVVEINGIIRADNLNRLICIIEALGSDNVLDLVESSSLNNVLAIYETVCPQDVAIKPGLSVNTEVLSALLVMCERGDSACQRALNAAFDNKNYNCDWDVCPCCKFLQSKRMRAQCKTTCDEGCS